MGLTRFALRSPMVVAAITLMLALFGLYSYFNMGIGIVPNISLPQVTIITTDLGADPTTVETQITKPIEDAVATLANIDQITSSSNEGISSITCSSRQRPIQTSHRLTWSAQSTQSDPSCQRTRTRRQSSNSMPARSRLWW